MANSNSDGYSPRTLKKSLGGRFLSNSPDLELSALLPEGWQAGKALSGDLDEEVSYPWQAISQGIEKQLYQLCQRYPNWEAAEPIFLGSWGRGELSPLSDLDLLFLGPEKEVLQLVEQMNLDGLRVRYRVPQNFEDWSEGVLVQDWLSLWNAKAGTAFGRVQLQKQQDLIFGSSQKRRKIVQVLSAERIDRSRRFDSIHNFLEPNLKYGAGGLRDIFQGQVLLDLFKEDFLVDGYEKKILTYYFKFFLSIRQLLHLHGFKDALVASEQFELSQILGFQDQQEFMRQVQRGISRVSFYTDWILATVKQPKGKRSGRQYTPFEDPDDLIQSLSQDSGILMQYRVRRDLNRLFGKPFQPSRVSARARGAYLEKILSVKTSEDFLISVFRSRLIDKLCPRILPLVGYVQHDQYHRYSTDIHIMQTCRELKRVYQKPTLLGSVKKIVALLGYRDWQTLTWSALYHDLAKGQKGREHGELGAAWVLEDLPKFGVNLEETEEISWLVKNHLALSTAAFRKNPQDPETWQWLNEIHLTPRRLHLLTVLTAVDIRASHPEAWTSWKARLLLALHTTMTSGPTQNFLKVIEDLRFTMGSVAELRKIDHQIFEAFTVRQLSTDLKECIENIAQGASFDWKIMRDRNKKTWIRLHVKVDRKGVLADALDILYACGVSVQHAMIQTLDGLGVYDFFQIQTKRDLRQLKNLISRMRPTSERPSPEFLAVDLVSQTSSEWIFSFRGVDQKGLLLRAATVLTQLDCHILSARVHTWGRQIEDLIHVKPLQREAHEVLEDLRQLLVPQKD